jgi:glycosyltransferase involved in cell wall biosynthesis
MKAISVLYITRYYSQACEGTYGRFHDIIHTLLQMGSPPIEPHIIPINRYAGEPDPRVSFRGGTKLGRYRSYAAALQERISQADVVHVVQGDPFYSFLPVILAPRSMPMVVGPNVSTGQVKRHHNTIDPWTTKSGLLFRARISRFHRSRFLLHRRSPYSRRFDQIIGFSEFHRDCLVRAGLPAERTDFLPGGVRADIFTPNGESIARTPRFTILFVGSLRRRYKGFETLLEGLAKFKASSDIPFDCWVVGGDKPKSGVIQALGLDDDISFFGFVPRAELGPYYRAADVFVNPSFTETDGNTAIEALACGLPAITSDLEPFESKATLTFRRGSSSDLARQLMAFYERRDEYKTRILADVDRWSIDHAIDKLATIYHQLLSR